MTELEVHHVNVSQGDCTLIILRNIEELGKSIAKSHTKPTKKEDYLPFAVKNGVSMKGTIRAAMLIDAGEDVYGEDVAAYLTAQGIESEGFEVIATHYHSDHVGGLRDVFFKFDRDRDLDQQVVNLAPSKIYDCGDLPSWDKTMTRTIYRSLVKELKRRSLTTHWVLAPNNVITLGKDKDDVPVTLSIVASNGSVSDTWGTTDIPAIDPKKSPDQNARSVALVLQYGDFRYFLGGDLGGNGTHEGGNFGKNEDTRKKAFYSTHADVEKPVTAVLSDVCPKNALRPKSIAGHICVHCANHHGSASSNDVFLLEMMRPKVVVCSSGVRISFHWHPTQEFFQRTDSDPSYSPKWQKRGVTNHAQVDADNTIEGYYVTEMAVDGKHGKGKAGKQFTRTLPKGKILGDVIVRPLGDAAPKNGPITIQVYGTGLGTDASVTPIPLRPFEGGGTPPYRIGPFTHTCDLH